MIRQWRAGLGRLMAGPPAQLSRPTVPPGMAVYAIGDIHGELGTLQAARAIIVDAQGHHAGIRPGRPLAVEGHSVVPVPQVLRNRVALDTGVYTTGVLSAAALDGERLRILQARR